MVEEELTYDSSSMDQVLLWILWTVDIYQNNDLFELQANLANQLGGTGGTPPNPMKPPSLLGKCLTLYTKPPNPMKSH
jgi:hypothetical protein